MPTHPTTEQREQSIHVICKFIGQIPCFHLCEECVAHRFSTTEIALSDMIHNAALDSTLLNIRCLNEFFGSNRQKDDIRAGDFSGVMMPPFLSPHEARDINKYLAHITLTRSDVVTKPWFPDDMVVLGFQHGIAFLSMQETSFPPRTEAGLAEVRGVRDAARLLISKIVKRRKPDAGPILKFRFGEARKETY
jgi:hypothetical protein